MFDASREGRSVIGTEHVEEASTPPLRHSSVRNGLVNVAMGKSLVASGVYPKNLREG
jgi:hypothetical protein